MAEIEAIGSAFEGMQTQNTRLLDGVTRRDEEFNKLTAKNIRCNTCYGATHTSSTPPCVTAWSTESRSWKPTAYSTGSCARTSSPKSRRTMLP